MTLLLILLGLAYGGIQRFLQSRAYQDSVTSVQAKLRRVVEVVSQDLRSAVFGAVIDTPYPSNERAVSFALLGKRTPTGEFESHPGYKVFSPDPMFWKYARFTTIVSPTPPNLGPGDHVLMLGPDKKAVILKITGPVVPTGPGRWTLPHPECPNTLDYTPTTLLFPVVLYGLRYDPNQKELMLNEDGVEAPLAFEIDDFTVDYLPDRNAPKQLRIALKASRRFRNRTIERSYSSVIPLNSHATFQIEEVVTCNP